VSENAVIRAQIERIIGEVDVLIRSQSGTRSDVDPLCSGVLSMRY